MTPEELRAQADRYRAMSGQFTDAQTVRALKELADEYEALARNIGGASGPTCEQGEARES